MTRSASIVAKTDDDDADYHHNDDRQVNGFPLPLVALLPLHLQHPPHPQQHGRVTGRTGGPHDGADYDGSGVEDDVDDDGVDDHHGDDN